MEFDEFELRIEGGRPPTVEVLRSPVGERKRVPLELPPHVSLATLSRALGESQRVTRAGTRDVGRNDEPGTRDVAFDLPAIGRLLGAAVLHGAVRSAFDASRAIGRSASPPRGLRLRLRITEPSLAQLPWELLFDEAQGDYVALSSDTPIVRHLEVESAASDIAIDLPLRILGMYAAPEHLASLDGEAEAARIKESLGPLAALGDVELTWVTGQDSTALARALLPGNGPWHAFHFIGHGTFDAASHGGAIVLRGADGRAEFLSATDLARLLTDHPSLRLVVLNACDGAMGTDTDLFASVAGTLVRQKVPIVVAMQHPITDDGAIAFARMFYDSLARGLPVESSVGEGRKALARLRPGHFEWAVPVVHLRSTHGELVGRVPATDFPEFAGSSASGRRVAIIAVVLALAAYTAYMMFA